MNKGMAALKLFTVFKRIGVEIRCGDLVVAPIVRLPHLFRPMPGQEAWLCAVVSTPGTLSGIAGRAVIFILPLTAQVEASGG